MRESTTPFPGSTKDLEGTKPNLEFEVAGRNHFSTLEGLPRAEHVSEDFNVLKRFKEVMEALRNHLGL